MVCALADPEVMHLKLHISLYTLQITRLYCGGLMRYNRQYRCDRVTIAVATLSGLFPTRIDALRAKPSKRRI